jgi:Domain of unknown function (DUF4145)
MNVIGPESSQIIYCNRCHSETLHALCGECKKKSSFLDDYSQVEVYFAETYSLFQCQVCGQGRLQVVNWNSENGDGPLIFHPAPECRRPPEWLMEIEGPQRAILSEVYFALNAGMYSIALMGVRSVLDVWVSEQTSGKTFSLKLDELVKLGILSVQQVELLKSVFDAGSAAAHRGYVPSFQDAISATEALENLLHQNFLVPKIDTLNRNTPKRGVR